MRPSAARVHTWQGEAAVTLSAGSLEATFLPGLGMLGVSLTDQGEELVAMPASLDDHRRGVTTGVPLMHPWANRLARHRFRVAGRSVDLTDAPVPTDANGLPMHGIVQAAPFTVQRLACAHERAVLDTVLDFGAHRHLLARFPFPHRLRVLVALRPGHLRVTTEVTPTGRGPVPVAFGWHPYLHLPRSEPRAWTLRLPPAAPVPLDERLVPAGTPGTPSAFHGPLGDHTFDHLFRLGPDRRFELADAHRRLVLRMGRGFAYAQIYRPPRGDFVCVEPMVAAGNALVAGTAPLARPGTGLRAAWSLQVAPA